MNTIKSKYMPNRVSKYDDLIGNFMQCETIAEEDYPGPTVNNED